MFNIAFFVIVLLIGLMNANAMSIKRSEKSENNLEKIDETQYPLKVNYDVYPVRNFRMSCWFTFFFCLEKCNLTHVVQQVKYQNVGEFHT